MDGLMLVLAGVCAVGVIVTTLADRADGGCWICDYDPDCRLCEREPVQGDLLGDEPRSPDTH